MIGFNIVKKETLQDDSRKRLLMLQVMASALFNDKDLKIDEAKQIAKREINSALKVLRISNNFNKDIKDLKELRKSCRFATFGGNDFDRIVLQVSSRLNSETRKTLTRPIKENVERSKSYNRKAFGLDTTTIHLFKMLDDIDEGLIEFNSKKLVSQIYPFVLTDDDRSIVDIMLDIECHKDFNSFEVKHKFGQIKNIVKRFPYIESTQRFRFLKQSLTNTLERNTVEIIDNERNFVINDLRDIFIGLEVGQKSKIFIESIDEDEALNFEMNTDENFQEQTFEHVQEMRKAIDSDLIDKKELIDLVNNFGLKLTSVQEQIENGSIISVVEMEQAEDFYSDNIKELNAELISEARKKKTISDKKNLDEELGIETEMKFKRKISLKV